MIFGIGIDIVAIHRMRENMEQYKDRFAHKILCEKEIIEYQETTNPEHYLAKHFAAKEAFVKALGTGFRDNIYLKDIYIEHEDSGRPVLQCNDKISKLMNDKGIVSYHLSLSDEKDYACACVILEK